MIIPVFTWLAYENRSQNSLKKKAAYMGSFHLNIAQIVI